MRGQGRPQRETVPTETGGTEETKSEIELRIKMKEKDADWIGTEITAKTEQRKGTEKEEEIEAKKNQKNVTVTVTVTMTMTMTETETAKEKEIGTETGTEEKNLPVPKNQGPKMLIKKPLKSQSRMKQYLKILWIARERFLGLNRPPLSEKGNWMSRHPLQRNTDAVWSPGKNITTTIIITKKPSHQALTNTRHLQPTWTRPLLQKQLTFLRKNEKDKSC